MCGIYITNRRLNEVNVLKKLKDINFRGPDNTGYSQVNEISLGHVRLSILDLDARSDQPMAFENLRIVYNGEIYNYLEIKEQLLQSGYKFNTTSDTEVLLAGYKEWGQELIPKINGMFAFAIYDCTGNQIFCARDRLGVKPFYYYWKDGEFEICSQIRPMADDKEINTEALSIYLDCGYIPSPYSIFENIYKLSPGHTLKIDLNAKKLEIQKYWDLKKVNRSKISFDEAKNQLHELLKDSVKIRLKTDVPIGCFLSGGIDSALISSIATKVSDKPIKTFSIGFLDPKYDETKIADEYAKIISSHHTKTTCRPEDILILLPDFIRAYDEPFADSSALPTLLLNSVTKPYVTVALSGDGGDESFLGYNHFESVDRFTRFMKIPKLIRRFASKIFGWRYLKNKFSHAAEILETGTINDFIEAIFIGYDSLQKVRFKKWLFHYDDYKILSTNPIQMAADLNIKLWLENDSNVKVDRASMAFAVEVRSPLLDYRVVEFARSLPVSFRYQRKFRKRILREILKEYIPEAVFDQPKKGFAIPLASWIRNELRNEFINNLTDKFLNVVPNLDVTKFKKMFHEHLTTHADHSIYIWRLYVLSKWYQEFGFYKAE